MGWLLSATRSSDLVWGVAQRVCLVPSLRNAFEKEVSLPQVSSLAVTNPYTAILVQAIKRSMDGIEAFCGRAKDEPVNMVIDNGDYMWLATSTLRKGASRVAGAEETRTAIAGPGSELHIAVGKLNLITVAYQLAKDAPALNMRDASGQLPLDLCATTPNGGNQQRVVNSFRNFLNVTQTCCHAQAVAKLLLDKGAECGWVGIYHAVIGGAVAVLKSLLQSAPAALHERDAEGNSLLHHAVKSTHGEREEIVKCLLEARIHPNQENKEGKTPLELSEEDDGGASSLVELLADAALPGVYTLDNTLDDTI